MASSSAVASFFLFISAVILPPILATSSGGGFSVELIHRESLKSPFNDRKSTTYSLLRGAAERSRARAFYFSDVIRKSSLSSSQDPTEQDKNIFSEINLNDFEYLMSFYLGTPAKKIMAIADTGSDLVWVQCAPHNQTAPPFDPHASSTYKTISCNTETCSTLPTSSCGTSSQCQYHYPYADESFVDGFLSTETIGFDSTGGRPVRFPTTVFGCTHLSNGTFGSNNTGLVGLGGGKLSLIRQLGSSIGCRFSYCLPSLNLESAATRLNFGSNANVSGSNAVTTPLISGTPDTFYFINLERIVIAGQAIIVGKPKWTNASAHNGNTIIDSGTSLTIVEDSALRSLENNLKKIIGLPQVTDPDGYFSLCFNVSTASTEFPNITFQFSKGASVVLPPLNAFGMITQDTACLAMISSGAIGMGGVNIFGNIAQQNFHIGYDLDAMQLTFAPTDCAKL